MKTQNSRKKILCASLCTLWWKKILQLEYELHGEKEINKFQLIHQIPKNHSKEFHFLKIIFGCFSFFGFQFQSSIRINTVDFCTKYSCLRLIKMIAIFTEE